MTETIKPLYQRIENAYASRFGEVLTEAALVSQPNYKQGKDSYDHHNPIQSTHELVTSYLDSAREQDHDPNKPVSGKLLSMYGQLVGYTHELIAFRDYDSLTLLLALAHLEPNQEVERALSCNQVVVSAMAESVFYYYNDSTTREIASKSAPTRISQIQNYYSIEGGIQQKALTDDQFLFDRLSNYPQHLRTISNK